MVHEKGYGKWIPLLQNGDDVAVRLKTITNVFDQDHKVVLQKVEMSTSIPPTLDATTWETQPCQVQSFLGGDVCLVRGSHIVQTNKSEQDFGGVPGMEVAKNLACCLKDQLAKQGDGVDDARYAYMLEALVTKAENFEGEYLLSMSKLGHQIAQAQSSSHTLVAERARALMTRWREAKNRDNAMWTAIPAL